MKVWAIGNGQSRQHFDLNSIQDHTIGCNAIHRDYHPNEIVAVDRRMVTEILEGTYTGPIYTRPDWWNSFQTNRVKPLPNPPFTGIKKADIPFHWNSGPYAILLACLKDPVEVNLIGFDLWEDRGKVNNFYKDTPNYDNRNSRPVDPSHWIYQMERITSHFGNIHFVQHQLPNWRIPDTWRAIENLTINFISV